MRTSSCRSSKNSHNPKRLANGFFRGKAWSGQRGSEIRLIAAAEQTAPPAIDRFVEPAPNIAEKVGRSNNSWLEDLAKNALTTLHPLGLSATFEIIAGNAKQVLIEAAARWNADCIFLEADKPATTLPRTLGTTPPATAARASSSVEVVRRENSKS